MSIYSFVLCTCNSEALITELQENLKEMIPRYYIQSDIFRGLTSSITHQCVTRRERIILFNLPSKYYQHTFPHQWSIVLPGES